MFDFDVLTVEDYSIKNTDTNKLKNEFTTALAIAKKHNYDSK